MSLQRVLENWSDYDLQKSKGNNERLDFVCEESWETAYLADKILATYPHLSMARISRAIQTCCMIIPPPRPRAEFVRCALRQLELVK
jgi:hypothetical protein